MQLMGHIQGFKLVKTRSQYCVFVLSSEFKFGETAS